MFATARLRGLKTALTAAMGKDERCMA